MRVAAVDCGTNSARLLVTDLQPGGKRDVDRRMRVVRLGQGVDRTGSLAPAALERTRVALTEYATVCRELDVEQFRLVATSATRDAENRHLFTEMVREVLGVDAEVITGEEEAVLSFAGATGGLDPAQGPFLVVDIGGGSTEFVLGEQVVLAARSVDIGCVRLTERHLVADPPTRAQISAARADVDTALSLVRAVVPLQQARTAVGVAGSVTTVAALALGLSAYDPAAIHLSRIPAGRVHGVCERLLAMTRQDRAALPVMHPGRIDVIGAGALILEAIVTTLGLTEVLISETDILDGIALSMESAA